MKNIKRIVAAMLIAAMLLAGSALAAGKIKTDGQVNLRKGAGLDYASVGIVKSGKVLSFDKTRTDERGVIWYHVKGGWISSKYTTQVEGSVDNDKKASGKTVKATGDMYLRTGPGLDYGELDVVKAGMKAKYLDSTRKDARGVAWYKVSFNGMTGWVSSKYGKLSK